MDATPFFSIILPTYNRARVLDRAIESVREQTVSSWELLVVDDGSTDHTEAVVAAYDDRRVRYICHEDNRHVAAARNTGIAHAHGTYICFLDSDDRYLPNHLAVLREEIERAPTPQALFYTLAIIDSASTTEKQAPPTCTETTPVLIGENPETPAICIHSDILEKYKFIDQIKVHSDAELWGRIAAAYPVYQIREHTVVRHMEEEDRIGKYTLDGLHELTKTYTLIWESRDDICHIPKQDWRRKMSTIYQGMVYQYHTEAPLRSIYYGIRAMAVRPLLLTDRTLWRFILSAVKNWVRKAGQVTLAPRNDKP
jgi:glycosyltransferase involved in cell wall biosynthesis